MNNKTIFGAAPFNITMEVPKSDEERIIKNALRNGYLCVNKVINFNTITLKFELSK